MDRDQARNYAHRFEQLMSTTFRKGSHFVRKSDMPRSQFHLLRVLKKMGTCSVSDLASTLEVTLPAVTSVLNELVKSGYVVRKENPDDRRVILNVLTDKGEKILDEAEKKRRAEVVEILQNFDTAEMDSFLGTLSKLLELTADRHSD